MTKGGTTSASSSASTSAGDSQRQRQQQQHLPPAWPIDQETNLFVAMRGHKPVGVDRHFQMLYISEKLNSAQRDRGLPPVPIRDIWALLDGLYSMPALHDSEVLPFPNPNAEFALPSADSPDWKPVMAAEFPRVAGAATPGQRGGGSERKRGRPARVVGLGAGVGGTASPQAAPSSRSHSPAPSSEAGESSTAGSGASVAKKLKRGSLIG